MTNLSYLAALVCLSAVLTLATVGCGKTNPATDPAAKANVKDRPGAGGGGAATPGGGSPSGAPTANQPGTGKVE